MIAQIEEAGRVVETLAGTEINALLLVLAIFLVVGVCGIAWGALRLASVIQAGVSALQQTSQDQATNLAASVEVQRSMQSLLESINRRVEVMEDARERRDHVLDVVKISTEAARKAAISAGTTAQGSREDIATLTRTVGAGFERTERGISAMREQLPDVVQRLDAIKGLLESAQRQHSEQEQLIIARHEANQQAREANDRAYRQRLDGIAESVKMINAYVRSAMLPTPPRSEADINNQSTIAQEA